VESETAAWEKGTNCRAATGFPQTRQDSSKIKVGTGTLNSMKEQTGSRCRGGARSTGPRQPDGAGVRGEKRSGEMHGYGGRGASNARPADGSLDGKPWRRRRCGKFVEGLRHFTGRDRRRDQIPPGHGDQRRWPATSASWAWGFCRGGWDANTDELERRCYEKNTKSPGIPGFAPQPLKLCEFFRCETKIVCPVVFV